VQEGKSGRSLTSLANWFDEAGTTDGGPQLFHGLFEPVQPLSRRQGKAKPDLAAAVPV
jgi:hypothetical protein